MERTRKTWGEKWNIFRNDLCEVSVLCLRPYQRCSWHRHRTKYNAFFVLSGKMWVKLDDGVSTGETKVKQHQIFTTRPGEWHEFRTRKRRALIIEIMYVKYDPADIERESKGGALESTHHDESDEMPNITGRPLSELGLDDLRIVNVKTGEHRRISGVVVQQGETILDAIKGQLKDSEYVLVAKKGEVTRASPAFLFEEG